ncbi:MAG: NERD domain-containing protein [Steroidobacteraceae bacterium]|nr:NERD domain-containing protein [Steroidobacteraceae bacterium]
MTAENLIVQVVVGVMLAALAAYGAVLGLRRWRQRQARRRLVRAFEACSAALLRDVLVPDGSGGHLHVDFLLLTGRGILVVDFRDVEGIVFGGEHMREWAVMAGHRRATFLNPLEALYDRMAAVRALAGDVPVDGRIVFTARAQFPKGRPPRVLRLASLEAEFPPPEPGAAAHPAERYRAAWDELVARTEASPLGRR